MPNLPPILWAALRDFGLNEKDLENVTLETRVFHDLGIYGDDFEALYRCLSKQIGGSGKVPENYIPSEFSRPAKWYWSWKYLWFKPFYSSVPPLTLGELTKLIRQG